jgi:hypothetical protein
MDGCERYHILKIDVDKPLSKEELDKFISEGRKVIGLYGYRTLKVRAHRSNHGWHIWVHIEPSVTYETLILLQHLFGDDERRTYYNIMRSRFKYRYKFNILFNYKLPLRKTVTP